ncbi:transposase family protein [Caloramator proteoclasticus]
MKRKSHICPYCKSQTCRIHDYRIQRVKHIPLFLKDLFYSIKIQN